MLGIGGDELVLIVIVALVAIGPKDIPRAMMLAGRWLGKARRMSAAFADGLNNLANESEVKDLEAGWAEMREAILREYAEKESSPASVEASDESAIDAPGAEPKDPAEV